MERRTSQRRSPGRPPVLDARTRAVLVGWLVSSVESGAVSSDSLCALAFQRLGVRISQSTARRILRSGGYRFVVGAGWRRG